MNKFVCVVKVETEAYKRGNKYFYGKTLRVIKSKSTFDLLEEEVSNVGIMDTLEYILNLDQCETGLYYLVTCNHSFDIESGHVDGYDLRLEPYIEDKK
jgi:hypothetical protein